MPFDGVTYTGASLIKPLAYHPKAGSSGRSLAGSLTASYLFAQNQGALIGHQNFFHYLGSGRVYSNGTGSIRRSIISASAVDVAQFRRWIPPQATHIVAEIAYKAFAETSATAKHSVAISLGSDSATGDTVEQAIDVATTDRWRSGGDPAIGSWFTDGSPGFAIDRCVVAVSSAITGNLGDRVNVTVKGHATFQRQLTVPTTSIVVTGGDAVAAVSAGHQVQTGDVISTRNHTHNATGVTVSATGSTSITYPLAVSDQTLADGVGEIFASVDRGAVYRPDLVSAWWVCAG